MLKNSFFMSKDLSWILKLLWEYALIIGLFLTFFLLSTLSAGAQTADIAGSVILEPSNRSPSGISVGGYRSFGGGSDDGESSTTGILIWIEDKNKNTDYTERDTGTQVLDQVDKQFSPRLMAVRVGDSVRIKNSDPLYHNVFSLSKTKRFDVGRRSPNDYEDVVFDKPGVVDVFCDIHSDMHAVIRILPENTVTWMKLDENGSFIFEDIPVGEYLIHFLALEDREQRLEVSVNSTEPISLGTIRL